VIKATTVVPMIITALNFYGSYLVGNKVRWGWCFNITCQVIWLPYAYFTQQWFFMAASVVWAVLLSRNFLRWSRALSPADMVEPGSCTMNFEGHNPRECGEHRTVGEHRAWCHECAEWCYPGDGCKGCRLAALPEWKCPNCGAVTRARMADQP
jgi:hypothetical protein